MGIERKMVKKEMDDDAPLPIPGAAAAKKPTISRKSDGTFVIKYPNGTEKPIPFEKLPQAIKDKCKAQDDARKKAAAAKAKLVKKEPGIKKRKLKIRDDDDGPRKKRTPKKSKFSGAASGTEDEADDAAAQAKMRAMRAGRSAKDNLIAEFLSRWWFCWPEYPPRNFDYSDNLSNAKLREVDIEAWEDEKKVVSGLKKCYQLSTFPGQFRDCEGHLHDLRPQVDKPSYNYLNAMSEGQIATLLVKAYTNQMEELKKSPYVNILPGKGIAPLEVARDRAKTKSR